MPTSSPRDWRISAINSHSAAAFGEGRYNAASRSADAIVISAFDVAIHHIDSPQLKPQQRQGCTQLAFARKIPRFVELFVCLLMFAMLRQQQSAARQRIDQNQQPLLYAAMRFDTLTGFYACGEMLFTFLRGVAWRARAACARLRERLAMLANTRQLPNCDGTTIAYW